MKVLRRLNAPRRAAKHPQGCMLPGSSRIRQPEDYCRNQDHGHRDGWESRIHQSMPTATSTNRDDQILPIIVKTIPAANAANPMPLAVRIPKGSTPSTMPSPSPNTGNHVRRRTVAFGPASAVCRASPASSSASSWEANRVNTSANGQPLASATSKQAASSPQIRRSTGSPAVRSLAADVLMASATEAPIMEADRAAARTRRDPDESPGNPEAFPRAFGTPASTEPSP